MVKYQRETSVHLCFPLQRPEACPPNSWKQFAKEYSSQDLAPGYTEIEGHEECLVIIGTSEPVDHCMPEFKRPNCLLQVWQDLQEFDIQSCPSSSPGADPTGLPPAYLSVPNHQDCLGLEDFGSHTKLCLPSSKPSGCLDASWEALNEVFEDKCSPPEPAILGGLDGLPPAYLSVPNHR